MDGGLLLAELVTWGAQHGTRGLTPKNVCSTDPTRIPTG